MLVLSVLFCGLCILITTLIYSKVFNSKFYLGIILFFYVFFTMLSFAIWAGTGHAKLKKIYEEIIHLPYISIAVGYCFGLAITSWIFAVIASIFAYIGLKQLSNNNSNSYSNLPEYTEDQSTQQQAQQQQQQYPTAPTAPIASAVHTNQGSGFYQAQGSYGSTS